MAFLTPTVEREELGAGRVRVTVHTKPVAYDDGGTLRPIVTDWVDSGVVARPHMVSAAKVMVSAGDDGMRRIHPTHEADRYLEIGAPYVRVGGVWTQVSLGTPTRSANLITWTRPQTITRIIHAGHYVKLDIELLGGYMPANRQVAFPVGIQGLTRDGLNILRDGVAVGQLRPFVLEDAANPEDVRPIAHQFTVLNGQPYLLLTLPDSTGMARPRIDPTYTDGPSGDVTSSVDTYLFNGNPDKHFGSDNNIIFDGAATRKVLMRFDLSALSAAATCDSATLYLYLQATHAGDRVNDLYMVAAANSGWAEGASADPGTGLATWNNKTEATAAWAGSAGCSTAGTDYVNTSIGTFTSLAADAVGAEYAFTLTAATVEDWFGVTNPGMVGFGSFASICSSDHATTGYRPKLVVTYTEAGGSPQTINANAIASTATIYAPALTMGAVTISVNAIASTAQVYAPALSFGAITVTLETIVSTATVAQPAVTMGAVTVSPNAIASAATVYQPAVTLGGLVIQANAIGSTATVYAPALSFGAVTVSVNAIASGAQVFAPSVETGVIIHPDAIASAAQVFQPALTFGPVTIAPAAIASTATVYQPAVQPGAITIAPNAIASVAVVYAPAVTLGAATISPDVIASGATVYAPALTFGAITVSPNAIASASVVYQPAVMATAAQAIYVNTIGSTATVYAILVAVYLAAAERTYTVEVDDRSYSVAVDVRVMTVAVDDRIYAVEA